MNKYIEKISGLQENVKAVLNNYYDANLDLSERQHDEHSIAHGEALLGLQGLNHRLDPTQAEKVISTLQRAQYAGINGTAVTRLIGATGAAVGAGIAAGRYVGGIPGVAAGAVVGGVIGNKILGYILGQREAERNKELSMKRENQVYGAYATMAEKLHRLGVV